MTEPIDTRVEPTAAVLSYPYEGGLFYLLSRENKYPAPLKGHPYYEALYGENPELTRSNAVNLASLFDKIILPPADDYLPDSTKSTDGKHYYNSELRLAVTMDWEFSSEARNMADRILDDPTIIRIFSEQPDLPKDPKKARFLLARITEQLKYASDHEAVLIADDSAAGLISAVSRLVRSDIHKANSSPGGPAILKFNDKSFKATALSWNCENVDAFRGIRQSNEITQYATGFRKALLTASKSADLESEMRRLMRQAMSYEAISKRTKGAFETTGLLTDIVGFIPVVGNIANVVGLGSSAGSALAERKVNDFQWYLLGPKMHEVDLQRVLREGEDN